MSGISKVLIGGGSGFIGRRLMRHLKLEGYEPIMVSRREGEGRMTWNELYQRGIPANCKAVVNLAGENIGNPFKRYNDEFKSRLYDSRVETTKQFADAILKAENPPEVFIGASAIGYYKPDETARYTEDSPGGDYDFLSNMVADWEKAGERVRDKNVRHVTVRVGLVLGREGGLIHSLYLPFFFGTGGRIGSGKQWTPWIHAEDIAGIFLHAIKDENVTGILNGVAPQCVRNEEFVREFAKAMNRPAFLPMPEMVVNTIFGKERGAMMTSGQFVIPKRTLESGYKFQYDNIREACVECSRMTPDAALYHYD